MTDTGPVFALKPDDFTPATRRSLFACAFWMAAADAAIRPREQAWFDGEFGSDAASLLDEFVHMDPGAVIAEADRLPQQMADEDTRPSPAQIKAWLLSLAHVDSFFALVERRALVDILRRIGIPVRPALFVLRGSTPEWQRPRGTPSWLRLALSSSLAVLSVLLAVLTVATWAIRHPITYTAAAVCAVCILFLMLLDTGP